MSELLNIWTSYIDLVDSVKLKALIVFTLILFALSVIVAIRDRRFVFAALTNTLDNSLIPLFGGLLIIGMVTIVQPEWASFIPTMWGVLNLMIFGLIAVKGRALGLPIPALPWIGSR